MALKKWSEIISEGKNKSLVEKLVDSVDSRTDALDAAVNRAYLSEGPVRLGTYEGKQIFYARIMEVEEIASAIRSGRLGLSDIRAYVPVKVRTPFEATTIPEYELKRVDLEDVLENEISTISRGGYTTKDIVAFAVDSGKIEGASIDGVYLILNKNPLNSGYSDFGLLLSAIADVALKRILPIEQRKFGY